MLKAINRARTSRLDTSDKEMMLALAKVEKVSAVSTTVILAVALVWAPISIVDKYDSWLLAGMVAGVILGKLYTACKKTIATCPDRNIRNLFSVRHDWLPAHAYEESKRDAMALGTMVMKTTEHINNMDLHRSELELGTELAKYKITVHNTKKETT